MVFMIGFRIVISSSISLVALKIGLSHDEYTRKVTDRHHHIKEEGYVCEVGTVGKISDYQPEVPGSIPVLVKG